MKSTPEPNGPYRMSFGAASGSTDAPIKGVRLPASECSACGEHIWHGDLAWPEAKFPKGYPPEKLAKLDGVPREEFAAVAEQFHKVNPTIPVFLPGGWVGPLTLKITGKLRDVIWVCVEPFFSKRLVDAMQSAGVHLHPAPVTVLKKGKRIEDYYHCRPALAELWSARAVAQFFDRCKVCGDLKRKKSVGAVFVNHNREYDRSAWPAGEGIVYSPEHMDLFFSDEFVEICRAEAFEGLAFERRGRWC